MCEDMGAEEVDGDIPQRLVAREQISAVEIAKDPVEVFLKQVSPGTGRASCDGVPLDHSTAARRAEWLSAPQCCPSPSSP
jgi:hypothetical protein